MLTRLIAASAAKLRWRANQMRQHPTFGEHFRRGNALTGFNVAYNGRRQRVLKGRSPDRVLRERLKAKPELAKPVTKPPDPEALPKALKVAARAKEVSHPGT
jgi:hypothetical protein